jgi:hypothetical protein
MSELPEPRSFDAASEHVTEDDIAALVPCGPDIDQHVTAARQWIDAGFTHLALVQVGSDHQAEFMTWQPTTCCPHCASSDCQAAAGGHSADGQPRCRAAPDQAHGM